MNTQLGFSIYLLLACCALSVQDGALAGDVKADFRTSDRCVACHNGMTNSQGDVYSIGIDWASSLMANASRDPYWQASLRRETMEHGNAAAAIEDECSSCHMAIPQYRAKQQGALNQVFAHLPLIEHGDKDHADGVTCSVCHQITPERLGTAASYNGNFVIDPASAGGTRPEYGPYEVDTGLQRVMRSSTGGYQPEHGDQIRAPELCASCHTLITQARNAAGEVIGSLPEQMPYQEWQHSDFRTGQTCQACHMPAVAEDMPVTRILGVPRPQARRHQFIGANFVMQRILGRYHDELDVAADPQELYNAADRTVQYLQSDAADLRVSAPRLHDHRVEVDVTVANLGGHKLPTAFPARRTWLHIVVKDHDQHIVFESGALKANGSIAGNDNDDDPARYEPHYREIRSPDQVQIYEAILGDSAGNVTTGLLQAVGYLKDNRLLPRGFDKTTASADIAVHGDALMDPGFTDRGHTVRYSVDVQNAQGPFIVEAELWYQPIGYRWAANFKPYTEDEPQRFTGYFESMGAASAAMLRRVLEFTR